MYVVDVTPASVVRAWRPSLPGVAEVFHARFSDHRYPIHVHDTWTLLIVDDGLIGYDLDRHEHAAQASQVTLLPPHVAHDGHAATRRGFRKRVLYLEEDVLGAEAIGRAVDRPTYPDVTLQEQISRLDRALIRHDDLEAEARLALVIERLQRHLAGLEPAESEPHVRSAARLARQVLDERLTEQVSLAEVAGRLGVTTAHLVRSFHREFGLPPHRYVVGRRVDRARRLILDGLPLSEVAVTAGFHDQAHLSRHFRRMLSTTPGSYQRSGRTSAGC